LKLNEALKVGERFFLSFLFIMIDHKMITRIRIKHQERKKLKVFVKEKNERDNKPKNKVKKKRLKEN